MVKFHFAKCTLSRDVGNAIGCTTECVFVAARPTRPAKDPALKGGSLPTLARKISRYNCAHQCKWRHDFLRCSCEFQPMPLGLLLGEACAFLKMLVSLRSRRPFGHVPVTSTRHRRSNPRLHRRPPESPRRPSFYVFSGIALSLPRGARLQGRNTLDNQPTTKCTSLCPTGNHTVFEPH